MSELGIYEYLIGDWLAEKDRVEVIQAFKELVELLERKRNIFIIWEVVKND